MPTKDSSDALELSVAATQRAQQAFIARGLASLEAAKKSGEYVSSEEVLRKLDEIIASAEKKAKK
jgi:predicted transcriptional regulator